MGFPKLRRAVESDEAFLVRLEKTRGEIAPEPVELDEGPMIIEIDGEQVGMIHLENNDVGIGVYDLLVLCDRRREGIASHVLAVLQDEAVRTRRLMLVYVPRHSDAAHALCLKRGFYPDWEDDQTSVYYWNLR